MQSAGFLRIMDHEVSFQHHHDRGLLVKRGEPHEFAKELPQASVTGTCFAFSSFSGTCPLTPADINTWNVILLWTAKFKFVHMSVKTPVLTGQYLSCWLREFPCPIMASLLVPSMRNVVQSSKDVVPT